MSESLIEEPTDFTRSLEDAIRELRSSLATFATSSTMMGLEGILCNENGGFGGQQC